MDDREKKEIYRKIRNLEKVNKELLRNCQNVNKEFESLKQYLKRLKLI